MRYVVYGAGAVGGVLGGRLHEAGHDVLLIARGAHYDAIRATGLRVESPSRTVTLAVPVAAHPRDVAFREDDVVLLGMKTQDTAAAVRDLAEVAPPDVSVVSVQNGVANEAMILRSFGNVYGVCVLCPTAHLEPGVVQAYSDPIAGVMDVGRYPAGADALASEIASAFTSATFTSDAVPDIMRWKYGKLLMNLGNAIEALCGLEGRASELFGLVRDEGIACLRAAGIDFATAEEDGARRAGLITMHPIGESLRGGGSSWQSLARATGSVESDYLNGEIVLLGRIHGVPTPVNELLQRAANQAARDGLPPGSLDPEELLSGAQR